MSIALFCNLAVYYMYITKLINADLIQFGRHGSVWQLITCPAFSNTKFFSDDESHSFVFASLYTRTLVGLAALCTIFSLYLHYRNSRICVFHDNIYVHVREYVHTDVR
jgi:hypothetical protein